MNSELIKTVKKRFEREFGAEGLTVFSPGRINLIGEHTDYNNGYVFPAAIDKGIALVIAKSDENYSRIISIDMEEEFQLHLKDINSMESHTWKNYMLGVIAELINNGNHITNFNCVFKGDIPVGSGLSSSAALENSLAFGCNELFELGLTKMDLIHVSQRAEHNYVGVKCGIMDQFASMFGVANHALFLDCKTLKSDSIFINLDAYDVVLVNSNVKHDLAESAYNERYEVCQNLCNQLDKPSLREVSFEELEMLKTKISESDYKKGLYVLQENKRVLQSMEALKKNDIKNLGTLLFESHEGQSKMYNISCEELDFLVDQAKMIEGVIGARMMGGGFGGCTINLVEKSRSEDFQESIKNAYKQKFNRNCSIYRVTLSDGTRVVKA